MFIHYRTKGFILKKVPRGESDELFVVFSKGFGRINILARGIRKIQAKLRASAPLFSLAELEFIQGKHYKTLTGARLIKDFSEIKKDLGKLETGLEIADLFNKIVRPPQKDKEIWRLLAKSFSHLNLAENACQENLIYFYFFWQLLYFLGYQPELYHCLSCRRKLQAEGLYFSARGGIVCYDCLGKHKNALEIEAQSVKILREIFKKDLNIFLKLKAKTSHKDCLSRVGSFYLQALPL